MSRKDRDERPHLYSQKPNPDPLASAIEVYRQRFGAEALPHLAACPDVELAAWLLRDAVVRGVPLDRWAVMEASGGDRPPMER
jgi:hypothetical protein